MGMASIPFKPKRKVWRCKTRQQPSKQQTSVAHVLEAVSTPVKMSTLCDYIWCHFSSVQSLSCPTICDPMDCSTPGLPVHHQLPESTQTHLHCQWCAIQPSHPVVPSSYCLQSFQASGSFQVSQPFASGGQSIGSFGFNISPSNEHSGPISFRMDWLDLPAVQKLSRVFSNTTIQKHRFFGAQLSL